MDDNQNSDSIYITSIENSTNDDIVRNIALVCDAINHLQKKNVGRYLENAIKQCKTYGWNDEMITTNIDEAIKSGNVIEKMFNSKPSLRVKSDEITVTICDPVENVSTNTINDYVSLNEFIDYKGYVNDAINNINYVPIDEFQTLKEQLENLNRIPPPCTTNGDKSDYHTSMFQVWKIELTRLKDNSVLSDG